MDRSSHECRIQLRESSYSRCIKADVLPNTTLVLSETFSNPLMRALDLEVLINSVALRELCTGLRLVIDHTISTPTAQIHLLNYPGIGPVLTADQSDGGHDQDIGDMLHQIASG